MRPLSPTVWASPQLAPDALPALAGSGVRRLVNNRPDGEEPGQPSSAEREAAARAAGLEYLWIPVMGLPTAAQVDAVGEALADDAPTVMFCRSGMRSAAAWAMAQARRGEDPASLRSAAAAAGYDIGRIPL
jgi:uncharacterized protein (TIGR01244 family)